MTNKEKRIKQVKDYIHKVISEITAFIPIIHVYEVRYVDEKTNSSNGEFSIKYEPVNFYAEFYVYEDIFERMPDKGMTEGFKRYIKLGLGHEVGHCYIWELEGTHKDTEKVASLIGFLIAEILDNNKV